MFARHVFHKEKEHIVWICNYEWEHLERLQNDLSVQYPSPKYIRIAKFRPLNSFTCNYYLFLIFIIIVTIIVIVNIIIITIIDIIIIIIVIIIIIIIIIILLLLLLLLFSMWVDTVF